MQKLHIILPVFVIICISLGVSYGNDAYQKDARIIENAILELKKQYAFQDREILNIKKYVKAQWHPNGAHIFIILLNDRGKRKKDESLDLIELSFDGPPGYDFYWRGGSKSHTVEKFIKQINEKHSNSTLLINFIQKDLIVTLEFADGDKVVFAEYYNDIKENLTY